MKLENRCLVPAGRDTTWALVMDIPRAAGCVPGMQDVTPDGEGRYNAAMRIKVGPMTINLSGSVQLVEQDPKKGEARYLVEAADRRIGGSVRTHMTIALVPQADGQTELAISSDTAFMGRLGELGQPLIRRKASATVEDFARNLAQQVDQPPA